MKRKKAGRKTRKKPPAVPVRLLRDLGGEVLRTVPSDCQVRTFGDWEAGRPGRDRTEIGGVPLPPDLELAVRHYTGFEYASLDNDLTRPPWTYAPDGEDSEANYPGWKEADIPPAGWHEILRALERCFRQGFFLALLRYADDLKRSAEAAPLLEGLREAASKGAAARRKQAEPLRKAVCKRFRELRKTVPKKQSRHRKIAGELEISERHVQRIVNEADLD